MMDVCRVCGKNLFYVENHMALKHPEYVMEQWYGRAIADYFFNEAIKWEAV